MALAGFFVNLASTISDYSVGGISWTHQVFFNFMNGRPFQSSLFASLKAGDSVGFSYNPHPYINTAAIHVNFTSYAFAPLWALWPNLFWLYGVVFLVNYVGMAFFAWKILQHLSPASWRIKTLTAIALLLSSGFLFTIQQKAQLLLFCGPFILAAYYFLLRRRLVAFLVTVVLLCMVSEDAAMLALTFAAYIFFFARGARAYSYSAGALALVYLVVVLLVVQPAARHDLVLTEATTTAKVLKHLGLLTVAHMAALPVQLMPVLFFLPAFGVIGLLFGKFGIPVSQVAGLMLLAPLPHVGEVVVVGAAHHLMPVVAFSYLALVLALGSTADERGGNRHMAVLTATALVLVAALFLVGNLRVVANNTPNQWRARLYATVGRAEAARRLERSLAEEVGNRKVLEVARAIPVTSSLVFWTNSSVEGFIAGRSDIWKFPDYYEVADFLLIQRGARQSFFALSSVKGSDIGAALRQGRYDDEDAAVISDEAVNPLVAHLVGQQTHRVVVDEPSVVLLERRVKQTASVPATTVGLGWMRNMRLWGG